MGIIGTAYQENCYICIEFGTNIQTNIHSHNTPKGVNLKKLQNMGTIYTTSEINRNFKIKVFGWYEGRKINTLVGVSGLIRLIGLEMANKQIKRAFSSMDDKCVCKLRRGIKITFYVH